jgi:hypothetical protein
MKKSNSSSSGAPQVNSRPSTREDPLFKAAIAESLKTAAGTSPTKGQASVSTTKQTAATGRPPSVQGNKETGSKSSSGAGGGGDEKKSISRRSTSSEYAFPCPHCKKQQPDYEALQIHVFTDCAKAGLATTTTKSSSSISSKRKT